MKCQLDTACRADAIYRVTWKLTLPNSLPLQSANACEIHGNNLHEQIKSHHATGNVLIFLEPPCNQAQSQYFTLQDAATLATYLEMIKAKQCGETVNRLNS